MSSHSSRKECRDTNDARKERTAQYHIAYHYARRYTLGPISAACALHHNPRIIPIGVHHNTYAHDNAFCNQDALQRFNPIT